MTLGIFMENTEASVVKIDLINLFTVYLIPAAPRYTYVGKLN